MWIMRKKCASPLSLSLRDACDLLREEIDCENFVETDWSMLKQESGALRGFNEHELWLSKITIAKADLLRLWPPFLDWEAVKLKPWRPSADLSVDWMKSLPVGENISLSAVIDLLTFGKSRAPVGLSDSEIMTARLRVGLAIDAARRQGKLQLLGRPAQRNPKEPQSVRSLGPLDKIGLNVNGDAILLPVPYGACDWLGPLRYIEEYEEIGFSKESVRFIEVTVHRDSLRLWLADLSGEASERKGGRPPEFPWGEIKAEAIGLMDYHGDFSTDDEEWNAQARLEEALTEFCSKKYDRVPSPSTLREKLPAWLAEWRNRKLTVEN